MSVTVTEERPSVVSKLPYLEPTAILPGRRGLYNTLRYLWENGWLSVRFEKSVNDDGEARVTFFGRLRDHETVLCWVEIPKDGQPWRLWSGVGRDMLLGEHETLKDLVNAEVGSAIDLYDDLANGRIPMEGHHARFQA